MSDELPKGWAEVELRECVDVLDNQRVPVNSDERAKRQGEVPYYGATGQVGWIDEALFNEELLLIGEDGAPFFDKSKPIAYVINGKSWVNNHAHVIRAKSGISSNQYLKWFLDCFDFNEYVNGTTRLKLTQGAMNRIPVRLAPITEQRRIVAKLEKLLGQVADCQQRLEKMPTLLKRFRQSILAAACSGRLTADWREENPHEDAAKLIESVKPARPIKFQDSSVRTDLDLAEVPESWVWTNLRYLISPAEAFCYGVVQPGENNADGVFLVRAGDLVAGRVDTSSLRRIPRSIHDDYRRSQLLGGEILVTVVGAGIGETAIAQPECAGFNIARAVAKLPIREFEARYVHLWLLTSCAQNWMKGDSREVARPTLNLEQLQTLPVPIPPLAEQQEIVRRVAGLFALADQLEQRLAQARKQVDKLTPSLLARAFAGQLVPQNPADEPAEKLLERIHAQAETKSHRAAEK